MISYNRIVVQCQHQSMYFLCTLRTCTRTNMQKTFRFILIVINLSITEGINPGSAGCIQEFILSPTLNSTGLEVTKLAISCTFWVKEVHSSPKEIPCKDNSKFVILAENFGKIRHSYLQCTSKLPLDINLVFAHPSSIQSKLLNYFAPFGHYFENKDSVTHAIYYRIGDIIYQEAISTILRLDIFYPRRPMLNIVLTIFKRSNESSSLIYQGKTRYACKDGGNKLVLPCESVFEDERPHLFQMTMTSMKNESEIGSSEFSYDPGIGFTKQLNLQSTSPRSIWYFCQSTRSNVNNRDGVKIILETDLTSCGVGQTFDNKIYDINGTYLNCEIDFFGQTLGSRTMYCQDLYNLSTVPKDFNFQITSAIAMNVVHARNRIYRINDLEDFNKAHFQYHQSHIYKYDHLFPNGVIVFESKTHFRPFEYFTDLDDIQRLLGTQTNNEFNTSWIIRLNTMNSCEELANGTISTTDNIGELYSESEYCFQCRTVLYFSYRQIAWYSEHKNESIFLKTDLPLSSGVRHKSLVYHYGLRLKLNQNMIGLTCQTNHWDGQLVYATKMFPVYVQRPPNISLTSSNLTFNEFEQNRSVFCRADGVPLPTLNWFQNGKAVQLKVEENTTGPHEIENRLKFSSVYTSYAGEYECVAKNVNGESRKTFRIDVIPEPDPTIAIIVTSFIIALVFGSIMLAFLVRKLRRNMLGLTKEEIANFKAGKSLGVDSNSTVNEIARTVPYDERSYEVSASNFTIDYEKILGNGAFGVVYSATIGQNSVAMKTVREHCTKFHIFALLSELKLMAYIGRHENIIALMGAYTTKLHKGKVFLFLELCEQGSLYSYLRSNNPFETRINQNDDSRYNEITTQSLINWSYEITKGMEYLSRKRVIHGDLATRNVLLTGEFVAKISDFGLSRKLYQYTDKEYHKETEEPLPWRWMSPEALLSLTFSEKSDVWAFGITLWEIFSFGNCPYPGQEYNRGFITQLINGERMEKPEIADDDIFEKMSECWITCAEERPTFMALLEFFSGVVSSTDGSIRPNRCRIDLVPDPTSYTVVFSD